MTRQLHAVIFDFDYMLPDSSRGVVECFDFALDGLGLPAVSSEAVRRTIGMTLEEALVQLVGGQGG